MIVPWKRWRGDRNWILQTHTRDAHQINKLAGNIFNFDKAAITKLPLLPATATDSGRNQ